MPDPTPSPAPARPWLKYAINAAMVAATVAGWVLFLTGKQPAPPPLPDLIQQPATAHLDFVPATGWVPDPAAVRATVAEQAIPAFGDTPAGKAAQGDEDAFLWRAVRKAAGLPDDRYPNVNQRDVGCCVGCGFKHCVDVVLAVQVLAGLPQEWRPTSVESIYGPSRVEVGGGRIRGDGSVGAWAAKAVQTVGTLAMQPYDGADLTTFEPLRAREWGRTGMPDRLEPLAREHTVKTTALVRTWAEVKRAVKQGYPVAVCSDQGFRMQRSADGTAQPSGTWAHCVAVIGVRTTAGGKEQGFVLNSWGDQAHTGPREPADMPPAGFWADAAVIGRMVGQGDSFALSDAAGFPARQIDWFAAAPRRPQIARPELALAW